MRKSFLKKFWVFGIFVFTFILLSPGAFAAKFKITAELLEPFNTGSPVRTLKMRAIDNYVFNQTEKIEKNSIFTGTIVQIKEPKRGKRDACFYYKLTSFSVPSKGDAVYSIKNKNAIVKVTLYSPLDKKEIAIDAGTTVAGFFVEYIALPVNFVRGATDPYEGKNRVESGVQKMYEKSFLSYISEGKPMHLNEGDKVNLTFTYKEKKESE